MIISYSKIHLPAIYSLILFFIIPGSMYSQENEVIRETTSDNHIYTILLHRSENELSWPVLYFNDNEKLTLRFDYLGESGEDFYYSIYACTYDWKPNENPDYLYLDGFNTNLVENKYTSFNTWKNYEHFMTQIPSDDMKLLTSGNYILKAYRGSDSEDIVFTKRFIIAEQKLSIESRVKKPDPQNQEIQLEIGLESLDLVNPLSELKIVIVKNNDWQNQVELALQPVLRGNKLFIDMPYQAITGGGNEFRYFNIKSTKYISDRLDSIKYISPETHVYLKPEELRQYAPYFSSTDLNGLYMIDMEDAYDKHIEADYVKVYFVLETPQAFTSEVYVYGALTNWKTDTNNYMTYNTGKGVYEKSLMLKQGYYNYAFATDDIDTKRISFDYTEGNHSETENEYAIFVYLRKTMSDFDRLVGFQIINSTGEEKATQLNP